MAKKKIVSLIWKSLVDKIGIPVPDDYEVVWLDEYPDDEEFIQKAKGCEYMWFGSATTVSDKALEGLSDVRFIQALGVGYNGLNLDICNKKGIIVSNNRAVNARPTAELALALMLMCLRRLAEADKEIKEGRFFENFDEYRTRGQHELGGCKVGIVGLGAVGRSLAAMLRPFGPEVVYYDIQPADSKTEEELGVRLVSRDELFRSCDIISFHVPASKDTFMMIDKKALSQMKEGVILINAARGDIFDTQAIVEGLESGYIGAAGLDVLYPEPPELSHPFFHLSPSANKRVVLTPHMGGTTDEAFARMMHMSYENFRLMDEGKWPNNVVNHPEGIEHEKN